MPVLAWSAVIGTRPWPGAMPSGYAESQRVASYYAQQTKQREEREAAEARARQRNGGAP